MEALLKKLKKASSWDRRKLVENLGPTKTSELIWKGLHEGDWGEFRSGSGKMREEHRLLVEHPEASTFEDAIKLLGLLSQDSTRFMSMRDHFKLLPHVLKTNRDALLAKKEVLDEVSALALEFTLLLGGEPEFMSEAAYDKLMEEFLRMRNLDNSWVKEHGDFAHVDDAALARAFVRHQNEHSRRLQNLDLYARLETHLSDEEKIAALVLCDSRAFVVQRIRDIKNAKALLQAKLDEKQRNAAFPLALLLVEAGEEVPDALVESLKFFGSQPETLEDEKRVFQALGERAGPVLAHSVSSAFALMPFIEGEALLDAALLRSKDSPERYAVPIGKMGERALPAIKRAMEPKKPDKKMLTCIAMALGAIQSAESADLLVALLGDSSKPVRAAAQASLGQLGEIAKDAVEGGLKARKKAVREACEELNGQFSSSEEEADTPYGKLVAGITEETRQAILKGMPTKNDSQAQRTFGLEAMEKHGAAAFVVLRDYIVSGTKSPNHKDASANAFNMFATQLSALASKPASDETLAMADPVFDIVAGLPKMRVWDVKNLKRGLQIFGKDAAPAAAASIRRNGRFPNAELVYSVAAKDPSSAADVLVEGLDESSKPVRTLCVEALSKTPDAFAVVLPLLKSKKKVARQSAATILKTYAKKDAAEALAAALAKEKSDDVRFVMEDALQACGGSVAAADEGEAPQEAGTRDWEAELTAKKARLPKWIGETLELKLSDGPALSAAAAQGFIARLKKEHERKDSLAWALGRELEPASAAAFGASLMQMWRRGGSKAAGKWVLYAQALLANEEWVHAAGENLGGMASMGRHAAATWHLEVFRRHGSKAGRDWIGFWADNAATHTLRKHAIGILKELIAESGGDEKALRATLNGFVLDERREEAVGTLGFDAKREQALGEYTAFVQANGELGVKDAEGLTIKSIPTSAPERSRYKDLRSKLGATNKFILRRFVRGMIGGRLWDAARFQRVFVEHPILASFASGIVFARGDGSTVRLSAEGTLLNAAGDDVPFEADSTYRIVHPIDMDEETKRAWGVHLADFEILQPFPQIARRVFENTGNIEFDRDLKMKPNVFIGRLRDAGWRAGAPEDAGNIFEDWMRITSHGVQLNLSHTGYHASDSSWVEDVRVTGLSFTSTMYGHLPAKKVEAIVFSEAQHAMNALFAGAEEEPSAKAVAEKVDAQGTKTRAIVNMSRGFPSADLAKSSRAKCMFCDEKIMKADVRIIIERMIETPRFTGKGPGYMHPACAPKWVDEAALDFDDFVEQVQNNSSISAQLPEPFDA